MKSHAGAAFSTFAIEVVSFLADPWGVSGHASKTHAGIGLTGAALEVVAEFSMQDTSDLRAARLA